MPIINLLVPQIIGAFFRRFWGGWEGASFPHMFKVVLGYVLMTALALDITHNLYAALAFGGVMGTALLNPFHAWGMGMGYADTSKSTLGCCLVMGGSYGAFTTLGAAVLVYFTHHSMYVFYAATGFLTWLPYLISWKVFLWFFETNKNPMAFEQFWQTSPGVWLVDGPTAVGELCLGALLFSL
jgi:hypothetical protein